MIEIMLVSRQEKVTSRLRSYLAEDSELEIVAEAAGADQALEKVEALLPDVLLINSDADEADALSIAERVILRKPRTFVIVLMEQLTLDSMRTASAAGCHNITEFPESSKELCDYVHRVYTAESEKISALNSNESVTWSSKIITLFGAKGGLGKTTIAVNLAVKLAEQKKKVAVIDLDLLFGDVHLFMDIDPKETIADLMQESYSANIDSVRSYMSVHPSGVHVLCAPRSPEYAEIVTGERIQSLLGLLRSYYDYVIIDTSANFADPTLAALETSSIILLVTGLDISILKNSKTAMNILESLGQKKKVRAIINRAVEVNSITITDVQRIVDAPILSRIPSDYMTAVAALNQGQPFVQSNPKAKLSLAISDIASAIMTGADNFDLQKLTPRQRRALMRKYRTKERSEKKRSGVGRKKR